MRLYQRTDLMDEGNCHVAIDMALQNLPLCLCTWVYVWSHVSMYVRRIQTSGNFYSSPLWFLKHDHLLTMVLTDWLDSPSIHPWNLPGKNTTEYLTPTCIHIYTHTHKHRGKIQVNYWPLHPFTCTLTHINIRQDKIQLNTWLLHVSTHTFAHINTGQGKIQLNSGPLLKRSLILRWMWPIPGR